MPKIKKYYVVVEIGGNTTTDNERLVNSIARGVISELENDGLAKPNEIKVRIKPMPLLYDGNSGVEL